jgi:hypothetical protein
MKKHILLIVFFCTLQMIATASSSLFYEDLSEATSDPIFSKLHVLEQFLLSEGDMSFAELEVQHPDLIAGISKEDGLQRLFKEDPPLGIPSFLFGCILSVFGVLLVGLVGKDSEETMKAFWGCTVSTCIFGGCYVLLWFFNEPFLY